jgi:hypothetical protein
MSQEAAVAARTAAGTQSAVVFTGLTYRFGTRTATGDCVEQAIVRALNLNTLATVTLEIARLGRHAEPIPPEDIDELPDLGSAFNDLAVWRYHVAKAHRAGF